MEKIKAVSDLREEYLAYNKSLDLGDDQFREKVDSRILSDRTSITDLLNSNAEERSYSITKVSKYPLFNALKELTKGLRMPSSKQKELVTMMLAYLSLAGLSTYKAEKGDNITLAGPILTLDLKNSEPVIVDFARPLSEARNALVALQTRRNLTAFKEDLAIIPGGELDQDKSFQMAALEQVLDSGSIVRVRQALKEDHSFKARKEYWNTHVVPRLGQMYDLMETEIQTIPEEEEQIQEELKSLSSEENAKEITRLEKDLRELNSRKAKLERMVTTLKKLEVKKDKKVDYSGSEDLNMIFVEFYRYNLVEDQFGKSKAAKKEAGPLRPIQPRIMGPER